MGRWEMYQRTVGYAVNTVGALAFLLILEAGISIWGLLFHPESLLYAMSQLIPCNLLLFLLVFLSHCRYFTDLIFRSTETFTGNVQPGKLLPGTMAQSSSLGRRRHLIEVVTGKDSVPRKFILFEDILQERYGSKCLVNEMCSGSVTFLYLKRSKCIVDVLSIEVKKGKRA